ncbi:MAG TPA: hypothetical protein PLI09_15790 [Candidatus Hydrogenedentes bacterium]|nr:hypothetical protein [Candidatus Hydrogenedentota bacterium]
MRDCTTFQSAAVYRPELDIGSDVAMVYACGPGFAERADGWRANGYGISMMTGIAWGGYDDYYMVDGVFKKEEVQTTKTGKLYMHGNSTTVGYNVPSDAYIEYIKRKIEPVVDYGVQAIYLEEPEYWAETGWSEAFKKEWEGFYGEPWQAPDSSPDAQYRASKLKYELYFKALREVFKHAKERARAQGKTIECHVPTHSLINYAQWRIVSPESYLMELAEADGYIAQVWTGTARSRNVYKGVVKERTFETAYLEYGQMLGMVRPTGRKVWFLADPVEDNPNRSWNDYKKNYECTIIASLMWPEVYRFEVMPWPDRIFQGTYPKVDLDSASNEREGIPAEYATQLLTVINALNDMNQSEVKYETGSRGIGMMVSDTLMFQRAEPMPSDAHLGSFFGLAMPLVKHGVPVEIVQLETVTHPSTLVPFRVILLTYEGQKPLTPEYHEALAAWVKNGGALIYIGDESDPYNHVREWWNNQGQNTAMPQADLFMRLGITRAAYSEPEAAGKGFVRIFSEKPRQLARYDYGAQKVIELAAEMCERLGEPLRMQNYLKIQRGPYIVASVLDESVSDAPLAIEGRFIDLFDAALPFVSKRLLHPNERCLLYDLDWVGKQGMRARVVASAARVRHETVSEQSIRFVVRGPKATTAQVCVLLPNAPKQLTASPAIPFEQTWDAASSTLHLSYENTAQDIAFEVSL